MQPHPPFKDHIFLCFGYLMEQYDFQADVTLPEAVPGSDVAVAFSSEHSVIDVRVDRFDVIVRMGQSREPDIAKVSLDMAVNYFTNGKVKEITDRPGLPKGRVDSIRAKLSQSATALRDYCQPVLTGEFTDWLVLNKFVLRKLIEDYEGMTGRKFPANSQLAEYIRSKTRWRPLLHRILRR